jgi:3-deoxy-7-phosphoheptulonate synthase
MIIAGPCSIEGENFIEIAKAVKKLGATHLRGGIFKPRSSPFRFSGLHEEAIEYALEAKRVTGLPLVTEAMSQKQIELLYDVVDIFQIGARNQTDSELLKEFGRQDKPVILKRGMATTIEEFVMYADFIINEGNNKVILCERGIRTFESYTRNTFDIACIPAVHNLCGLPIIADPSHGTGRRELVIPVALGAMSAGADGLLIEVHNDPEKALTDSAQSITIEMFGELMRCLSH